MCRRKGTRRDTAEADRLLGSGIFKKGELAMSNRLTCVARGVLVVAALVLMSGQTWAIYNGLGPSKDEWGLKYDVQVRDGGGDTVTVVFILADEGRLKPLYSVELIALSKETDNQGGHSYDVKAPIVLTRAQDGVSKGQVQVRR